MLLKSVKRIDIPEMKFKISNRSRILLFTLENFGNDSFLVYAYQRITKNRLKLHKLTAAPSKLGCNELNKSVKHLFHFLAFFHSIIDRIYLEAYICSSFNFPCQVTIKSLFCIEDFLLPVLFIFFVNMEVCERTDAS